MINHSDRKFLDSLAIGHAFIAIFKPQTASIKIKDVGLVNWNREPGWRLMIKRRRGYSLVIYDIANWFILIFELVLPDVQIFLIVNGQTEGPWNEKFADCCFPRTCPSRST